MSVPGRESNGNRTCSGNTESGWSSRSPRRRQSSNEILAADEQAKLAEVHLRNQHVREALEKLTQPLRKRVEIAHVAGRNVHVQGPKLQRPSLNCTKRAAPAQNQDIAGFGARENQIR